MRIICLTALFVAAATASIPALSKAPPPYIHRAIADPTRPEDDRQLIRCADLARC